MSTCGCNKTGEASHKNCDRLRMIRGEIPVPPTSDANESLWEHAEKHLDMNRKDIQHVLDLVEEIIEDIKKQNPKLRIR